MFFRTKVHEGEAYDYECILNSDNIVKINPTRDPDNCHMLYDFCGQRGVQEIIVAGSLEDYARCLSVQDVLS